MFIQLTNLCFPCCYDARLVDYDLVRDMEKGSLCFVLHNDIEAVELDGTKRVNTLKGNHIQGNFVAEDCPGSVVRLESALERLDLVLD